jgi:hypothetical protein
MIAIEGRMEDTAKKITEIDKFFRRVAEFQAVTEPGKKAKSEKMSQLEDRARVEKDAMTTLVAQLEVATIQFLSGEDSADPDPNADPAVSAS